MLELSYDYSDARASAAEEGRGGVLSDLVVSYLFLGGAGAGACLVLSVLGLLVPRDLVTERAGVRLRPTAPYRKLLGPGFAAVLVLLALGVVCLLADLGNVERVILLLVRPTATHLAIGSWALAACLVLAIALGLAWSGFGAWNFALLRIVEVLAVLAALVVMVYTGLLLQSLSAVPLWATPWLPALFVASSLSCGIACVLGISQITGAARAFDAVFGRLAATDAVVIVIEAAILAAFLYTTSTAGAHASNGTEVAAAQSARDLLEGGNAWLFWSCFAVLGLAVPLVLDVALARRRGAMSGLALLAAACVLTGGFVMRYCVVAAGVHPVLSSMGVM